MFLRGGAGPECIGEERGYTEVHSVHSAARNAGGRGVDHEEEGDEARPPRVGRLILLIVGTSTSTPRHLAHCGRRRALQCCRVDVDVLIPAV